MPDSVIELLEFAGAVVFALPVGFFGVLKLMDGEPLVALAFFLLAAVMVTGRQYVTSPQDLPGAAAKRLAGVIAKEPDDEE